jgi:hypothetical protein
MQDISSAGFSLRGLNSLGKKSAGSTGCGKIRLFCHSERSEESLFGLNAGKERFLGAQRPSE